MSRGLRWWQLRPVRRCCRCRCDVGDHPGGQERDSWVNPGKVWCWPCWEREHRRMHERR